MAQYRTTHPEYFGRRPSSPRRSNDDFIATVVRTIVPPTHEKKPSVRSRRRESSLPTEELFDRVTTTYRQAFRIESPQRVARAAESRQRSNVPSDSPGETDDLRHRVVLYRYAQGTPQRESTRHSIRSPTPEAPAHRLFSPEVNQGETSIGRWLLPPHSHSVEPLMTSAPTSTGASDTSSLPRPLSPRYVPASTSQWSTAASSSYEPPRVEFAVSRSISAAGQLQLPIMPPLNEDYTSSERLRSSMGTLHYRINSIRSTLASQAIEHNETLHRAAVLEMEATFRDMLVLQRRELVERFVVSRSASESFNELASWIRQRARYLTSLYGSVENLLMAESSGRRRVQASYFEFLSDSEMYLTRIHRMATLLGNCERDSQRQRKQIQTQESIEFFTQIAEFLPKLEIEERKMLVFGTDSCFRSMDQGNMPRDGLSLDAWAHCVAPSEPQTVRRCIHPTLYFCGKNLQCGVAQYYSFVCPWMWLLESEAIQRRLLQKEASRTNDLIWDQRGDSLRSVVSNYGRQLRSCQTVETQSRSLLFALEELQIHWLTSRMKIVLKATGSRPRPPLERGRMSMDRETRSLAVDSAQASALRSRRERAHPQHYDVDEAFQIADTERTGRIGLSAAAAVVKVLFRIHDLPLISKCFASAQSSTSSVRDVRDFLNRGEFARFIEAITANSQWTHEQQQPHSQQQIHAQQPPSTAGRERTMRSPQSPGIQSQTTAEAALSEAQRKQCRAMFQRADKHRKGVVEVDDVVRSLRNTGLVGDEGLSVDDFHLLLSKVRPNCQPRDPVTESQFEGVIAALLLDT